MNDFGGLFDVIFCLFINVSNKIQNTFQYSPLKPIQKSAQNNVTAVSVNVKSDDLCNDSSPDHLCCYKSSRRWTKSRVRRNCCRSN